MREATDEFEVFGLVAQEAESPPFFLDAEGGLAYLLDAGRRRMFQGLNALTACSAIFLL
jgi:hypothetical protein